MEGGRDGESEGGMNVEVKRGRKRSDEKNEGRKGVRRK